MKRLALAILVSFAASAAVLAQAPQQTPQQQTRTVSTQAVLAWPESVEVFVATGADMDLAGVDVLRQRGIRVRVHSLSAVEQLEAEMSRGLPPNPQAAAQVAAQRLEAGQLDATRLRDAWFGVLQARQLGLKSVPAVVFDDLQVVYGEPRFTEALRHYREYRARAGR